MDHNLEIRQCRVLVALSDHGSISAAARALGLAQSTVSETLLSLERLIDAPLMLRRPGRESALTATAIALLPHARALILASEAALAAAKSKTCVIRLGSIESASTFLLPSALAAFRQRWPAIELKISIGVCDDLRRKVQNDQLDAAITLDNLNEGAANQSRTRVLALAQLCLFVSRHTATRKNSVSERDIAGQTLLLPDPDGAFNVLMYDWLAKQMRRPRIESAGSVDGVKVGVRNGDCVGVLPSYAVAKELASGEFVRWNVRYPLPRIALGLVLRHPRIKASPLHDMIQYIEHALAHNNRRVNNVVCIHH